jgi:Putative zinc-finger
MTADVRHFEEEIQELLDNRLTPARRVELEKHLELCEQCRVELEALRWTKELSGRRDVVASAPLKLQENILAALDVEDRSSNNNAGFLSNWLPKRRALAYASLLLVALALVLSYLILRGQLRKSQHLSSQPELPTKQESPSDANRRTQPESPAKHELHTKRELSSTEVPSKPAVTKLRPKPKPSVTPALLSQMALDYRNYKADKLPLMFKTEDVKEMERFFTQEGIPFKTRVFDLGMMNYRLLGGRTHKFATRKSAFFVYRGKGDAILVCQMYSGRTSDLPDGAVLRENKGIEFYVYRMKNLTLVFWQEGAVTCVLASDIDPEELAQLAFAKAVKV